MNELILLQIINLCLFGAVFLFNYKSWLDYLRPDLFYIFNVYKNNYFNYKEYKYFIPLSKDLAKRVINECEYDRTNFKPIINPKGVYTWNFEENNQIPITFLKQESIDGKGIIESRKKDYYKMLIKGDNTISDMLPYIIIGLIILVIFALFFYTNQQNQNAKITTDLLINLTRK